VARLVTAEAIPCPPGSLDKPLATEELTVDINPDLILLAVCAKPCADVKEDDNDDGLANAVATVVAVFDTADNLPVTDAKALLPVTEPKIVLAFTKLSATLPALGNIDFA
jgi:hypothetical protein